MALEMRKLKYINTMIPVQTFRTGLESWEGIESLFSNPVRNRVICRFDLVNLLDEFFSQETLQKYRDVLYYISTGNIDDGDMLESFLNVFLQEDMFFHEGITKIYHACPYDKTFGEYFAIALAEVMLKYQQELTANLVGSSEFIICNSDGYLYISVPDIAEYTPQFLHADKFKEMYNGKNWRVKN